MYLKDEYAVALEDQDVTIVITGIEPGENGMVQGYIKYDTGHKDFLVEHVKLRGMTDILKSLTREEMDEVIALHRMY